MLRNRLALLLFVGVMPLSALAEPSPAEIATARRLFADAIVAEESKDWPLAAAKLREAISIKETAGLRFHLAYCEEQQGKLVQALVEYERAAELAQAQPKTARDVIEQLGPARDALRLRIPTLTVMLPKDAEDSLLHVDGEAVPPALFGKPVFRNPGPLRIDVTNDRFAPFVRELALAEGEALVVDVVFPASASPVASLINDGAHDEAASDDPSAANRNGQMRDWILVTEAAATAAALGIGIGYHFAASSAERRADDARTVLAEALSTSNTECGAPTPSLQGTCDALSRAVADGKSRRTIATIGFVGAGTFAAAFAGTWLFWPSQESSSKGAIRITPVTTARGETSFVLSGRF